MGPASRELRIESLRAKIAARQDECLALTIRSSSPWLTPENRSELNQHREQALEQYHSLRYVLNLYERQG